MSFSLDQLLAVAAFAFLLGTVVGALAWARP
jgi:hypothetical protein